MKHISSNCFYHRIHKLKDRIDTSKYDEIRRIAPDPENIPPEQMELLVTKGLVSKPKIKYKKELGKVYNQIQKLIGSDKKSWERDQKKSDDAAGVRG